MNKIVVLDKYILFQKLSKRGTIEIWNGRHRKSNQSVTVYIFPYQQKIHPSIQKWLTLCSYETSINHVVRYMDIVTSTYHSKKVRALVVKKLRLLELDTILKKDIEIYDRIRYFHQLVRSFCFIHGTNSYHGNLNSSSIVKDCVTNKLKIWKDPLVEESISREEEYSKCGKILSKLFKSIDTRYYGYINEIINCYTEEDSNKRIVKASPQNIYRILTNACNKIKSAYETEEFTSVKMVEMISIFKDLGLDLPCPTNIKNLSSHLHNILPSIQSDILYDQSRQNLKIIARMLNVLTPSTSQMFLTNIKLGHAILSYIYTFHNTEKVVQFIKHYYDNKKHLKFLEDLCEKSGRKCMIDIGVLEEYRVWYWEKSGKIHNYLIKIIVALDEWFYNNIGINWKDILKKNIVNN